MDVTVNEETKFLPEWAQSPPKSDTYYITRYMSVPVLGKILIN
jgi:hypothetical protein